MSSTPTKLNAHGWIAGTLAGGEDGPEMVIGGVLAAEGALFSQLPGAILDSTLVRRELPFPGGSPQGQIWYPWASMERAAWRIPTAQP